MPPPNTNCKREFSMLAAYLPQVRESPEAVIVAITSPANSDPVIQAPAPLPSDDQIMSFAYFIEQGDMNSTLRLNNNLLGPMTANVTFFNSHGESFTAPILTLPPQDVQHFRVAELTTNAQGDFHSGSVQVAYHGPPMAVTGQISMCSASTHLIFESFPTMSMGFTSTRLDGIVWIPDPGTQASAALTNTTSDVLTVNIGLATNIKSLTLNAHETNIVDLKDFLPNRQDVRAGHIRIEHNGTPGGLIVTGFALNEKTGFSCNLPFIDRATARTAHLAGAHVRLGRPGSNEGFPAGTRFNAPLLVANTGDQPTEARVFVDYTIAGVAGRAAIANLQLAPDEVRQVELSSAMARFVGSGPVDDAGVDIEYTGNHGAVIARLTSLDQSGDFAFDVPIKDPLAETLRVGGSYPWRLDNGFTTVLHLKNTVNQRVFALVQVRYDGGSYNLERLPLQPYQTIAVDLRGLRDGQQKDIRDSVMPSDVEGGQVVWFEETVGSLIGRAEIRNVAEGVASSFSCGDTCPCPPASSNSYLTPGSSVGPMGGTAQFSSMEQRQDCRGTIFGPYNRTSDSTWSSSDTNVFSVSSSGVVSCLQPGSGTVTAQFQATVYGQFCAPISITQRPGGPVSVFRLRISVSGSSIHFDDSDAGASIVAGEGFAIMVDAVDANGNLIALGNPVQISTSASRTLGTGEIGVPSSFVLGVSGHYDSPGIVLNRVNATQSGTSYRFSPVGGGFKDFFLFTYFRVTMDVERWKNCGFTGCPNPGSYVCQTACGPGLAQPTAFVSLTSTGLCNLGIKVGNPTNGMTQLTTVREVGPRTTDSYWNTGAIPVFNPNNKPATLGGCLSDVLMNNLGIPNGCSSGEQEYSGGSNEHCEKQDTSVWCLGVNGEARRPPMAIEDEHLVQRKEGTYGR
jgi:hypothetical protein